MLLLPIYSASAQKWWNKEFIIGMYMDPPQKTGIVGWSADTLWDAAHEAGFNLATGVQYAHGYQCDSIFPSRHANRRDIRMLYYDKHLLSNLTHSIAEFEQWISKSGYSGVNVKDEPKESDFNKVNDILNSFKGNNNLLAFVNLFPSYYKESWQAYEEYVNLFVNDSVPLNIVCFDNYFPHSDFSVNPDSNKYYSNLAYLRKVCGDRPLWSYVLTTEEKLNDSDEEWQKAFLRLSAFAPLAYGSKGILYYTFDMLDDRWLYSDFNYREQPGWENKVFYPTIEDEHEVFFGKMSSANNGKADMAIKTDANGGTWMVKLAGDTTNSWNFVFNEFGRENHTQPFIADWDHDHRHEFMAFVRDSHLFASHTLGGWKHRIPLQDIPTDKDSLIERRHVAAGCFNDNADPDFCIAWPAKNDSFLVRTYLDCKPGKNGWAFSTYTDEYFHDFIGLTVEADSIPWVITSNFAYDFNRTTHLWNNLIKSYVYQNETTDEQILKANEIQNYWMEGRTLCVQKTSGTIEEYQTNNGAIEFQQYNLSHSTPQLSLQGVYNASTDTYDMYGLPTKKVYGHESLTDANHRTTKRYQMVKENNLYIKETLAPIIMQCKWLGAWHASVPTNEVDSLIAIIDENTPLLKSMNDPLLVGIFEENDTLRHFIVVNKTDTVLNTCRLIVHGNFMNNITMKPRITSCDTAFMIAFRPDSIDTVLEWKEMQGGECIALSLHSHRPFKQRRYYEDFEGDKYPDISYLQFDSIHHNVLLKARYSSEQYAIERDLATFPYSFDEEHKKWIWNLSACYGEDALTDAAIFDGNAGVLYIKHRTEDSLRVDTTHFYITETSLHVPFSGDINGDGYMDFAYRADSDQNLRVHLSNHGLLSSVAYTFNLYGNSLSTLPIRGDWDGNGLEDISLYRADHKLLIDYAYKNPHLGLGTWDIVNNLDFKSTPLNIRRVQPFCRDWDGDGYGDLGLIDSPSGVFYIDLGYNGFGIYDIIVNLPLRDKEELFQVICDDWNQDGLDDLIYLYQHEEELSSISIDVTSDGLNTPNIHINL